jgi:hypothetical protein
MRELVDVMHPALSGKLLKRHRIQDPERAINALTGEHAGEMAGDIVRRRTRHDWSTREARKGKFRQIAAQLNIKELADWYSVTTRDVLKLGGTETFHFIYTEIYAFEANDHSRVGKTQRAVFFGVTIIAWCKHSRTYIQNTHGSTGSLRACQRATGSQRRTNASILSTLQTSIR